MAVRFGGTGDERNADFVGDSMQNVTVPLLDLKLQFQTIRDEVMPIVERICESQMFILGPEVEAFEKELADYCGTKYAVGVTSGSDSLIMALMALGIGPGDEVITTAYSFFATAGSIVRVGATPVFVDIDPITFNIDVSQIEKKITSRTRGIMRFICLANVLTWIQSWTWRTVTVCP